MKRNTKCTNCGYEIRTSKTKGQIISCSDCKGKFVENITGVKK